MNEKINYNPNYPSIEDLKKKAKKRIPKFAFEYLIGGCNEDHNLSINSFDFKKIQLEPHYIKNYKGFDMSVELFGHRYDAPIGISPIGLQGLIWPKSPQILAKAALKHNIPYILSTVSTESIEKIAEISEGKAWFQLYHPREDTLRDDIIQRVQDAQFPVLIILIDVPMFGHRPLDIKNGLSMPPRMTLSNIMEICKKPVWALKTLQTGVPSFKSLEKYMSKHLNLSKLGKFMNDTFVGRITRDKIAVIRDKWKGKLVVKGVASEKDASIVLELGVDGIIISNHGGRQIDSGESTIQSLIKLAPKYKNKMKIMIDSGLRGGQDIARSFACGSDFSFMGRPFMYGVAALGNQGGEHTIGLLKTELSQVMQQVGCEKLEDFKQHLLK